MRSNPIIPVLLCALMALFITRHTASCQQADVSLRIDFVAWGDDIPGLSLKTGNKSGAITALGFRYSTPVAYSGPALMEIHKTAGGQNTRARIESSPEDKDHESIPLIAEEPAAATAGQLVPKGKLALELEKRREKAPTLVALCPLPQGSRRVTVLLVPAVGGTYHCHVIDDDPSTLKAGHVRVHNLTSLSIAMRCAGTPRKTLKPRESFIVPTKDQRFIYELAYQLGDEWQTQESNIISAPADEQVQMIVLKSDNSFFRSSDGSTGGFLQIVSLRRKPNTN